MGQRAKGQALCWERTLLRAISIVALVCVNPPGWDSGRAEGLHCQDHFPGQVPSPKAWAQIQEGLLTTEGTVLPGLSAVPLLQGPALQGLS